MENFHRISGEILNLQKWWGSGLVRLLKKKKKTEQIGMCICTCVSTHMHITMGWEDIRKK